MDFSLYVSKQKQWSLKTFGEGKRTDGIIEHIKHELKEINNADYDEDKLEECIDVIILAMDIAWRLGFSGQEVENMLLDKQTRNMERKWPPKEVSEANQDKPTFYIKE